MDSQITNGKGGKPCWLRHSYSFERSRSAYIFQPWSNVILATPPIYGGNSRCRYILHIYAGRGGAMTIYILYYVRLRVVGGALTIYIYLLLLLLLLYIYIIILYIYILCPVNTMQWLFHFRLQCPQDLLGTPPSSKISPSVDSSARPVSPREKKWPLRGETYQRLTFSSLETIWAVAARHTCCVMIIWDHIIQMPIDWGLSKSMSPWAALGILYILFSQT